MSDPSTEKASATGASTWKNWFRLPSEEELQALWQKYRNAIYLACTIAILAILGQGIYKHLMARREAGIEATFAAAGSPEQLQAFVREHPGHPLAGAAYLKLGDDAYTAANYDEAQQDYEKAAAALKGTPFAARALMGEGVSLIEAGKSDEGAGILRKLADDTSQLTALRSEAAYHLASLAFAQHRYDEVAKLSELIMQVDSNGIWAQRAMMLQARIPASAATAPAASTGGAAPTVSVPLSGGR